MLMGNQEIAKLLREVAASYSIKNDQKFRFQIIAYEKAADSVENSSVELKDLYQENKLDSLPGIGPTIKSHLEELFKTGTVKHFQWARKSIPESVFVLMEIPTFGPKKSYRLIKEFKLSDPKTAIDDLEKIAKAGKIAKLSGFGEKSQEDILRVIEEFKKGFGKNVRMNLPYASEIAEKILTYMKKCNAVIKIEALGSLRRMTPTIGDVDIGVATDNQKTVIEHFIKYPNTERVIEKGNATASIIVSGGREVDLMTMPEESFGSLLQHLTGSKNHNVRLRDYALTKGLSLSEYGIKRKMRNKKWKMENYSSEKDFYHALSLQWIPPELREDKGEIEAATSNALPKLVEAKDIKGDLHIHSSFSIEPSHDLGQSTMEEMIKKAKELRYEYLGFSEHNPSISKHNKNQIYSLVARRNEKIEQIILKIKSVRIIKMLETDILSNGDLSIDNKTLELLDCAIVSIHSSFSKNKTEMTKRVIQGLSHPKAKILAHPTGRMLNVRRGYDLDYDNIFDFCKKNNKALEINSWPNRLDLPDTLVRQAVDNRIRLAINTDSHAVYQMNLMKYGVAVARRGWATKDDIINTLGYEEFVKWLKT